jgi:hypothetical protein
MRPSNSSFLMMPYGVPVVMGAKNYDPLQVIVLLEACVLSPEFDPLLAIQSDPGNVAPRFYASRSGRRAGRSVSRSK